MQGSTDSHPTRRRGRPPKNSPGLGKNDSGKPEGEIKSDKSKINSMADAGSHAISLDSVAKGGAIPNLNVELEISEQEVPEIDSTQAKQDSTRGTGVMGTVSPEAAALGFDINETFTLGNNENPDLNETATPNGGDSNVTVTEEVKSDPSAVSKTGGANQKVSASGINPRKRKARTSSDSSAPAVPVSTGEFKKRCRGRPSRLSHETFDGKLIDLSKQLGGPKVDDSSRGGDSDGIDVVKPEDPVVEGENVSFMCAGHNVSEHGSEDNNASKSVPDSMTMGTKQAVPLAQDSSKWTTEELNSSTVLKLKFKTSDSEPKLRRKRAVKINSSSVEQVNRDGSIKKPRGRPCKPKVEAPKSCSKPEGSRKRRAVWQHDNVVAAKPEAEIVNRTDQASLENSSGNDDTSNMSSVSKNPIPADVVINDMQDHPEIDDNTDTTCEAGSLKQGLSTEPKDVAVSEKSPTASGSSKEQPSEGEEKSETKRSS